MATKRKSTTSSKRLRRRATAYWRLANRSDISLSASAHYRAMANRLDRQADAEELRAGAREETR